MASSICLDGSWFFFPPFEEPRLTLCKTFRFSRESSAENSTNTFEVVFVALYQFYLLKAKVEFKDIHPHWTKTQPTQKKNMERNESLTKKAEKSLLKKFIEKFRIRSRWGWTISGLNQSTLTG